MSAPRTPHVVLVPSTPALLPAYAGIEDAVADVRAACLAAVGRLVACHPDRVRVVAAPARPDNVARGVAEPAGLRIARRLLEGAGFAGEVVTEGHAEGVLVVANGSATRGEKAPGHLDERAFAFDDAVGAALRSGDTAALADLDGPLAEELWCFDADAWHAMAPLVAGRGGTIVLEDDPFGVRYWVGEWPCGS